METISARSSLSVLLRLAKYNRDWPQYLLNRYRDPGKDEVATYRLRNGQAVSVLPEVRFTLNEIYLDRVYDVPGIRLADCRTILDLGANMGVFASYAAAEAPDATPAHPPFSTTARSTQWRPPTGRAPQSVRFGTGKVSC